MNERVNAVNRVVLALLGIVLLAAGAMGLAVSFGVLGDSGAPLLPRGAREFPADQPWFWWVVAAACLLVGLLGLLWLLAQLRTDRVGRLDLTTDEREGQTTVHASAVADAVESEIEALRGVLGATAHVRDRRGRRLEVTVDLVEHADLGEVRRVIEDRVVAHARQAVDDPDLPVDVVLRPGRARTASRGLA